MRAACGGVLMCLALNASAFELISRKEAARPDDLSTPPFTRAGPVPEPEIIVHGDTVTTSPFDLTIELRPGARSARINLDSLRVSYRKRPPADLKHKIKPFIDSRGRVVVIRIERAEAPVGKHHILLQVDDTNEQRSWKVLHLEIQPGK